MGKQTDSLKMKRNVKKIYWPKRLIFKLIEEFQKHEYLYNIEHNLYHNKQIRNEGYDAILNVLKKNYPRFEGNVGDVKIKWNILRTQYSSEMRKIVAAAKMGESVYKPRLYFYSEIDFMRKHTVPGTIDLGGLRIDASEQDKDLILETDSCQTSDDDLDQPEQHETDELSAEDTNDALGIASNALRKAIRLFNNTESVNYAASNGHSDTPPRKKSRLEGQSHIEVMDDTDDALRTASATLQTVTSNLEQNSVDISFAKYIKQEMLMIKSNVIRSDMRDRILSVIFDYKRKESKSGENT